MKKIALLFCFAIVFGYAIWFADNFIAPLFLYSRIERLHETGLPKAIVEGSTIHFKMKADDFYLPLPSGYHLELPIKVSGGFDTVDGTVLIRQDGSNQIPFFNYQGWVSGKLQAGAYVTSESSSEDILINFHYFGDK